MKPTKEQIEKLPKWAQDHIKDIERERFIAVRALDEYTDSQTPSAFSTEDMECTGESAGPTSRVRFIQAHNISVNWRGVFLRVSAHDFGNAGCGIRLQWGKKDRSSDVAFIPDSYQSARIVSKEDMR